MKNVLLLKSELRSWYLTWPLLQLFLSNCFPSPFVIVAIKCIVLLYWLNLNDLQLGSRTKINGTKTSKIQSSKVLMWMRWYYISEHATKPKKVAQPSKPQIARFYSQIPNALEEMKTWQNFSWMNAVNFPRIAEV